MTYDVIVIGAGAFGCRLAFHLSKKGKRVARLRCFGLSVPNLTAPRLFRGIVVGASVR